MDVPDGLTRTLADALADEPVAFAYLFGSLARGRGRAGSDVDVAVHFRSGMGARERLEHRLRLGVKLEGALGRDVDVVDLEEVPLRVAGRILTERVVVTGLERPERVRFETQLLPRYRDLELHARGMDADMLEAMAAGDR